MGDEARGRAIHDRRLALGILNLNQFYKAMKDDDGKGIDRETLTKAERGEASPAKMDQIEKWLHDQEVENGANDPGVTSAPIRISFHGLKSGRVTIDDLIVEGPPEHPDELAEAVSKILERFQRQD